MNVSENVTFESEAEISVASSLLSNIRYPSVLVKKQALIHLLNNADSFKCARETGDEGSSEIILDSNDKNISCCRPELGQSAKCIPMDITTRNVAKKSGHPSALNRNSLKQVIKEDLGQTNVTLKKINRCEHGTHIFQSGKIKSRKLKKRVIPEDEFPSGDIDQQITVSKITACHQKHRNKFHSSRTSKFFTNHDYDRKLPSGRHDHIIQTKRFRLCSTLPRVNLLIPFHEVQEFQRIQYQKAVKHRVGRQTYLSTTQLIHWFLPLHIARCNIFLSFCGNLTLYTQSSVLQDMPVALIMANTNRTEVTSSIIPSDTIHSSYMYYLITERKCYFPLSNRTIFHDLGQKQLCTIYKMMPFRDFYVHLKMFVSLFHSCQQVKAAVRTTYPCLYSVNTIISTTHDILNLPLIVLDVSCSLLVETVCRRLRGEYVYKNNSIAVPRRLCYSSLYQFSETDSVISYFQLVLCNIDPIIIKACKHDYVFTIVLDLHCSITSRSSEKLNGPCEIKAKAIIGRESLCYLFDFCAFLSFQALQTIKLSNYSPSPIVCNQLPSFLVELVLCTTEMIVWPTNSSFVFISSSIFRCLATVFQAVFFHTYFEETYIGDFQERLRTNDSLLSCALCFGVYEINPLSVKESIDVLNISTVMCILISETPVIDDLNGSLSTQLHISLQCNCPNSCICYLGVDLHSFTFDDCVQFADEVFVPSYVEHKVPESFSMECSVFQNSVLLSLENFVCLSCSLIVVKYVIFSPVIQCKLFTSIANSLKCENILLAKLLNVRRRQLQQRRLWTGWFYHSSMTTLSFIGASLSVKGLNSDDYWPLVGILLALTTCGCICLYKNFNCTK